MNPDTVERLNRLNREFYRGLADEWDRSRDRPWQGWERVAETIRGSAAGRRLSVLDAGCGNGRLATFLEERLGGFDYVGLDSSGELLERARARLGELGEVDGELLEVDLTGEGLPARLGDRRFDLVAAFGLLHHVPGLERRAALLVDLAGRVAPGGLLAVAFWQFAVYERFRRRFVDWEVFNRETPDPVDPGELEDGDHLLAWGDDRRAVRYCHWSGPEEIRELMTRAGASEFELYSGRGGDRFNLYALVRAGAGSRSSPSS